MRFFTGFLLTSVLPYCTAVVLQERVDATYRNQAQWTRMSIMSTAGMGKFSTDRTIDEYAKVGGGW